MKRCAQCGTPIESGDYCTPCRWSPESRTEDEIEPSAARWGAGIGNGVDGSKATDYSRGEQ